MTCVSVWMLVRLYVHTFWYVCMCTHPHTHAESHNTCRCPRAHRRAHSQTCVPVTHPPLSMLHSTCHTCTHCGRYIVMGLSRNRYCEHIGRHHKGNRVLIVLQLYPCAAAWAAAGGGGGVGAEVGVGKGSRGGLWWQKCQDPDCRCVESRA